MTGEKYHLNQKQIKKNNVEYIVWISHQEVFYTIVVLNFWSKPLQNLVKLLAWANDKVSNFTKKELLHSIILIFLNIHGS